MTRGERLRDYRKRHRVGLVELAGAMGNSPSTISRWERGVYMLPRHVFSAAIAAIDRIVVEREREGRPDPEDVLL